MLGGRIFSGASSGRSHLMISRKELTSTMRQTFPAAQNVIEDLDNPKEFRAGCG